MEPYFIGQIMLFAGNFAPRSWAFCDGQLLSISENTALFSILGTIYGGDGRSTFGLPDLRGRVARGVGTGPGLDFVRPGQKGGASQHILSLNELPSHNHALNNNAVNDTGGTASANGHVLTNSFSYSDQGANATLGPSTTAPAGNGAGFSTEDPYLGSNFIIALWGSYPARS